MNGPGLIGDQKILLLDFLFERLQLPADKARYRGSYCFLVATQSKVHVISRLIRPFSRRISPASAKAWLAAGTPQ